jgi:hypothetical protein
VRFLEDELPLSDKIDGFRQKLRAGEPCFLEFIIAEHYLKDGNKPQAAAAYRACLSYPGLRRKDRWLELWIRSRLQELTDGAEDAGFSLAHEGEEP